MAIDGYQTDTVVPWTPPDPSRYVAELGGLACAFGASIALAIAGLASLVFDAEPAVYGGVAYGGRVVTALKVGFPVLAAVVLAVTGAVAIDLFRKLNGSANRRLAMLYGGLLAVFATFLLMGVDAESLSYASSHSPAAAIARAGEQHRLAVLRQAPVGSLPAGATATPWATIGLAGPSSLGAGWFAATPPAALTISSREESAGVRQQVAAVVTEQHLAGEAWVTDSSVAEQTVVFRSAAAARHFASTLQSANSPCQCYDFLPDLPTSTASATSAHVAGRDVTEWTTGTVRTIPVASVVDGDQVWLIAVDPLMQSTSRTVFNHVVRAMVSASSEAGSKG